ncbi:MAG: FAD binding domain-containing protein, partial [Dehalococcoidales bacterium]|nr:FAD binding domain-containing protein [Dehalococcoidales bacterium]
KTISSLSYIKEETGILKIGALTPLSAIAADTNVQSKYSALAQAAGKTASPHLREMGTIGGNICQYNRCWYFRNPDNRFDCIRKGGNMCFAMMGDNRYHSIFGAVQGCIAVNPSDTAPALIALNAIIVTNKDAYEAENFWDYAVPGSTILAANEIVKEIQIPTPASGTKSAFQKFALRKTIDFPIVNCAVLISREDARICLNAVHNNPYRATKAEDAIKGKAIDEANAEAAGAAAVSGAIGMPGNGSNPGNKYKIQIAKTLVKRAILACK